MTTSGLLAYSVLNWARTRRKSCADLTRTASQKWVRSSRVLHSAMTEFQASTYISSLPCVSFSCHSRPTPLFIVGSIFESRLTSCVLVADSSQIQVRPPSFLLGRPCWPHAIQYRLASRILSETGPVADCRSSQTLYGQK